MLRKVITEDGLNNIQNHKYKGGVYTPLDNLLNPFWLALVEYLPKWFAPNLVTISGFVPMLISYLLAWWYCPDYTTAVPRWLALFTSFALFLYQTFDAMDGKQARRIGLSTPLGQLFDHGLDCLACLSHQSIAAMAFLPGGSRWGVGGLAMLQLGFFMAQWQERYTGTLRTNFGPVGVTETQYGLIFVALAVAIMGPELNEVIFKGKVSMPWGAEVIVGLLASQVWCCFVMSMCSLSLYTTISAAFFGSKEKDVHVCADSEGPPGAKRLLRCLCDLFPMLVLSGLPLCWNPVFFKMAPRLLVFLNGIIAFQYTAKMVLFTMAMQKFPARQLSLIPYAAMIALSRCITEEQMVLLKSFMVLYAAGQSINCAIWVTSAISQLKNKLGIYIFKVGNFDPKKTN